MQFITIKTPNLDLGFQLSAEFSNHTYVMFNILKIYPTGLFSGLLKGPLFWL